VQQAAAPARAVEVEYSCAAPRAEVDLKSEVGQGLPEIYEFVLHPTLWVSVELEEVFQAQMTSMFRLTGPFLPCRLLWLATGIKARPR